MAPWGAGFTLGGLSSARMLKGQGWRIDFEAHPFQQIPLLLRLLPREHFVQK